MDAIARLREIDEPETPISPASNEALIDRQIALVVGIDEYAVGIPSLNNAVRDARSVADVLRHEYGFMIWPDGQPLLDAVASDQTVRHSISESLAQGTATTRWLFYFAGHGLVVDQHGGYLLPADARRDELNKAISVRDLLQSCLDSLCGEVLIILDACYSGQALIQPTQLSDRFTEMPDNRICQIITSGNPDQPVLDGSAAGHSVFTQALLDALEGWSGIHEADGTVRFIRLLDHLVIETPRRLRALGHGNLFQQPVGGSLRGHRQMRSVTLHSTVPRLDPVSIRDARSEHPARRIRGLEQIATVGSELRPLAVNLAIRHLQRTEVVPARILLGWDQRFEPDPTVRAQAARTLGMLGDVAALDVLTAALDDPDPVRLAAVAALGTLGDRRAAPALLKAIQHASSSEFLSLAEAIAALGADDVTMKLFHIALCQGRLVPFIGPNLPMEWTDRMDRISLALALAQRAGISATQSLAEAAAGASAATQSRYLFTRFLMDLFAQVRHTKTPFQDALAKLGCKLVVAWNYDPQWKNLLGISATVSGRDAIYVQPEESAIVYLSGMTTDIDKVVVLAEDYMRLREQEEDRTEIVAYIQRKLEGKIILFLGHDPEDPDFPLLVQHILNEHLKEVRVLPILLAETQVPAFRWGRALIRTMRTNAFQVIEQLGQAHLRSK